MSSTGFHVSPDGVVRRCKNTQNCQFGSQEEHGSTESEAVQKHEQMLAEQKPTFPTNSTNVDSASITPQEFARLDAQVRERGQAFKEADEAYTALKKQTKETLGTKFTIKAPINDEMFHASQKRRAAYYAFVTADVQHKKHAEEHNADRENMYTSEDYYIPRIKRQAAFWERLRKKEAEEGSSFNPNPTFDEDDGGRWKSQYWSALRTIKALSGTSGTELNQETENLINQGYTRTEAVRELYKKAPQRHDKPFVYIDVETAARQDVEHEGRKAFDDGEFSEIIEVGYTKVFPDGSQEEGDFRLDMDPGFKSAIGTGWEEGHKISPDSIEGLDKFSDPTVQKKMSKVFGISGEQQEETKHKIQELQSEIYTEEQKESPDQERIDALKSEITEASENNGVVLVAHNLKYESSNFSHALQGYAEAEDNGRISTLDTKDLTQYFVNTLDGNSNGVLMETTGQEYGEDAHSAKFDADGTMRATLEVLSDRETYLTGEHENNRRRQEKLNKQQTT